MSRRVYFIIGVIISVLSLAMCIVHWNDHEVSAWIVAFTGWINYTLDVFQQSKD
jgi:hypothetical protein